MKKSVFVIEDSDEEDPPPVAEEGGQLADVDISQSALDKEEQQCLLLPIASPRGCQCCCWRRGCVLM
jgi:hypothetical protein